MIFFVGLFLVDAGLVLALDRRQVATQARDALLFLRQLLDPAAQLALQDNRLAAQVEEFDCCSFAICAFMSTRDFSSWIGTPNSESTRSRMIAPNPQQMQSRNDMLKTSVSRRRMRFMASPSRGSGIRLP